MFQDWRSRACLAQVVFDRNKHRDRPKSMLESCLPHKSRASALVGSTPSPFPKQELHAALTLRSGAEASSPTSMSGMSNQNISCLASPQFIPHDDEVALFLFLGICNPRVGEPFEKQSYHPIGNHTPQF